MKSNKLLIALALCAAMQPGISFGSEAPKSKGYWESYAPQFMQRGASYVSEKTTNLYNTVNSWSTQKKVAVASAIVASLALIYNRDTIIQWVSSLLPAGNVEGNILPSNENHDGAGRINPTVNIDENSKAILRAKKVEQWGQLSDKALALSRAYDENRKNGNRVEAAKIAKEHTKVYREAELLHKEIWGW
jgi:hypothetical protein